MTSAVLVLLPVEENFLYWSRMRVKGILGKPWCRSGTGALKEVEVESLDPAND